MTGMADEAASRSERDLAHEIARLRAGAAPAYELAYEEARRALDGQERALAAFRTRAGIVLSAAAIVTSFLGGQAIGASGFTTLSWVAIAAFAVVGVATLCVLWPEDSWQFRGDPKPGDRHLHRAERRVARADPRAPP